LRTPLELVIPTPEHEGLTPTLGHRDAQQLRELATRLMAEMRLKKVLISKLTHEIARSSGSS
jgi:hypothetical protein